MEGPVANKPTSITLKLSAKSRKAILTALKRRQKVSLALTATVSDGAGNRATTTKAIAKLKVPKARRKKRR